MLLSGDENSTSESHQIALEDSAPRWILYITGVIRVSRFRSKLKFKLTQLEIKDKTHWCFFIH